MSEERIGPGDVVKHAPSGEEWTVAYADYERNALAWCGWPEGIAALDVCALVQKATPEMRATVIAAWAFMNGGSDHRGYSVRKLYADEVSALERARAAEAKD